MDGVEFDSNMLRGSWRARGKSGMSFLNTLSANEIDFIEVLTGGDAAFYGMKGGNGAIIIHTRSTIRRDDTYKTKLTSFYPVGYSNPVFFSEPDYSIKEIKTSATHDQRSTIYWSAPLITDNNGNATVNFFTADPNTTYTVTIKGITASGDIFVKRFLINRK